jgi:hypothetical protein
LRVPPGTGKSHTIATLVKELQESSRRKIVITCPTNAGLCSIANKLRSKGCKFTLYANKDKEEFRNLKANIYKKSFERVVLCTMSRCFSLCQKKKISGVELIFDEAGIASEPLSLIPFMLVPVRCLLVGDINQLQPHVKHPNAEKQLYKQSMMERLQRLAQHYGVEVPRLDVCFRFGQELGDFCNENVYDGALRFGKAVTVLETECLPLQPVTWVTHDGWANQEHVNYAEITVVRGLLQLLKSRPGINLEADVVALCFYKAHVEALKKKLKKGGLNVPVHTIDSFQGEERKIVLVSFGRTNGTGFMKDCHRLNVALTRAKHCMLLVGNLEQLQTYDDATSMLRKLSVYVEKRQLAKSLHECLVLPAVAGLLDSRVTPELRNYFDIIHLPHKSTLVVKRLEAEHMSTTVNKKLLDNALQGNTDLAYRTALSHYFARKYHLIQDGPGIELFSALRDFHAVTDNSTYGELRSRCEDIAATAPEAAVSALADSIVIWLKFRLCPYAPVDSVLQDYSDLDARCTVLGVTCTKYLCQWGIVLMKEKRWEEAAAVLRRVAGVLDKDVTALTFDDVYNSRCLLAEVLHNATNCTILPKKQRHLVESWLEKAVELSDKSYTVQRSWAYEMLAGLAMDHGNANDAQRYAKMALCRHPGNVHAYRTYRDAGNA